MTQILLLTAAVLVAAAPSARAQRAELTGVITDQSGAVLPGVAVTLLNEDEGLKRDTITNDQGRFTLTLLPPGRSTLIATLSGFAPHEITDVFLNVGDRLSLVIKMDLAKLGESVTVVAAPALVSTPVTTSAAVALPPRPQPASPTSVRQPILRDRGTGVPTSMFGTYVAKDELLVYPFFEYYRDRNYEYNPAELNFQGDDQDFRGKYRATESLIFVGYGIGEDLAVEVEMAAITASLEKAAGDGSNMPARLEESGLGDVEAQLRWRWARETATRPELFSYGEVVFPNRDQPLTGTDGWELKFGTGLVRGLTWGTVTARAAVEYASGSTSHFDLGEYAVEYLRQISPAWRVYAGLEGTQDELSFIGEVQWHVTRNITIKINNGIGLTSKATDWAPEIGILCRVGPLLKPIAARGQRRHRPPGGPPPRPSRD
jgi:Carboxypeptidase regulatory-like domain